MTYGVQTDRWPVRVWPGLLIVASVLFSWSVPGILASRTMFHFLSFVGGPVLGAILAVVWWTAFARVRGALKWAVPALFVLPAVALAVLEILDGRVPMAPLVYGLPFVLLLWVGWLAVSFPLGRTIRQTGLLMAMAAGWVAFGVLRLDGTDADMMPEFASRFSPKPEERDEAELKGRPTVAAGKPLAESAQEDTDWAEFRGPNRDGIVKAGPAIDTDWAAHPPKQLWKQKIGPGWGTFAVVGDRLFTQEQLGDNEAVVCYDAATGNVIWRHFEKAKFKEQIAGAGPRATPTVVNGRLYAMGATGLLLCLQAEDGEPVWKTDITTDTGGKPPQWGYASSPLVGGGLVIVYAGGPDGKGTAAFDAATGRFVWAAGHAAHGYSSAQRGVIAGVEQIVMLSDYGLESFVPKTGKVLWEHKWYVKGVNRVTQPTVLGDGEFLIGTGVGGDMGTRRLKVTKEYDAEWKVEVVWSTKRVKPYFNDGVVHAGHLYGFDDKNLVCVNLDDGRTVWNAGTKFGHGQVLLLGSQGLLVIQAVDGTVYLLPATPDEPAELGKLNAISGKTWNHPVVCRGKLYVRNGTWAAAYELQPK